MIVAAHTFASVVGAGLIVVVAASALAFIVIAVQGDDDE